MNDIVSVSSSTQDLWMMMLKSIGMLCIVVAILVGVLFLIKQLTEKRSGRINTSLIKLVSSFHVAPKEKIMLVDVIGRKVLIGVTQQSINCLAVFDDGGDVKYGARENAGAFKGVLDKLSYSHENSEIDDSSTIPGN